VVLASVIPKTGPNDPQTAHLITLIRQVAAQGEKQYGLQTFVTGQTAVNVDVSAKLSSALPVYLAVIVVLCLLILLLVFRSVLVPVKAVIGYVLSILATLGALTFVFQDGHLAGVFAVAKTGPILSFLPSSCWASCSGWPWTTKCSWSRGCAKTSPPATTRQPPSSTATPAAPKSSAQPP